MRKVLFFIISCSSAFANPSDEICEKLYEVTNILIEHEIYEVNDLYDYFYFMGMKNGYIDALEILNKYQTQ